MYFAWIFAQRVVLINLRHDHVDVTLFDHVDVMLFNIYTFLKYFWRQAKVVKQHNYIKLKCSLACVDYYEKRVNQLLITFGSHSKKILECEFSVHQCLLDQTLFSAPATRVEKRVWPTRLLTSQLEIV